MFGGKWSAWKDEDGDTIESGLHVFFGAYDLLRELGLYEHIQWKEHVLTYTLAQGERFEFRTMKAYYAKCDELTYQQWHRNWGIALRMLSKMYIFLRFLVEPSPLPSLSEGD
jgi:15-cis-phytoene desaturase